MQVEVLFTFVVFFLLFRAYTWRTCCTDIIMYVYIYISIEQKQRMYINNISGGIKF
jgi:hypothetical protein